MIHEIALIFDEEQLRLILKALRHYNMPMSSNRDRLNETIRQIKVVAESENIKLD